MPILLAFALLAGAGTALSPCVLPILPALLSAGATGGRRRPLGIVAGLTLTYTITIVALASVVRHVGLADGAVRYLAVVVVLAFGLSLLWPRLGARLEAPLWRLARLGPRSRGTGLRSGLAVGAALGFLYAPCAGPILAAVISVSATRGTSAGLVAVGLAFALGSAGVLLALALGGRRLTDRLRRAGRGPALQRALGAVLVVTALAMATNLDVRFQTALANRFPSFLVNPTGALERSSAVRSGLAGLRRPGRFRAVASTTSASGGAGAPPRSRLRDLGPAPAFHPSGRWFNTGGRPLSLAALRGRVVLVDFWTYTCINCLRTLPFVKALDAHYRARGLTVVGVHTPEFSFEHDAGNVAAAIAQNGLRYPVVQDNAYGTWNAYRNQYWPAEYLIDATGHVRYVHYGEGDHPRTEAAVRSLLAEAGARRLGGDAQARVEVPSPLTTPETYLGSARAAGFQAPVPTPGTRRYPDVRGGLPLSTFALSGLWHVSREAASAVRGASIEAGIQAKRVFLVLGSRDRAPRRLRVLLDGRPIAARDAGADVHRGIVTVRRQRLYRLVALPSAQRRSLRIELAPGLSAYAFTFG